MKIFLALSFGLISLLGCASVKMVAPKDAIKLDVSMRMDIYQHMAKDINSIEDQVSGPSEKSPAKGKQSFLRNFLGSFISNAYADDTLGPEAQAAVSRRHERHAQLAALEAQSAVGESANGLVKVKIMTPQAQDLVDAENNDRMIIYKDVAQKNGGSLDDVGPLYAKRLQADAPAGTPIEGPSGWTVK